MVAAVFV